MVYGRGEECSLCERALKIVHPLAREFELAVRTVDVSTDAVLFERYQFVIPVVVYDDVELGSGRLRGDALERNLRAAMARPGTTKE